MRRKSHPVRIGFKLVCAFVIGFMASQAIFTGFGLPATVPLGIATGVSIFALFGWAALWIYDLC